MWIKNPRKALTLISKFLKPNGHFILFSYSKDTPYVQLFEEVLEKNFPELKKASAVNTMLPTDLHSEILTKNHMALNVFKVEDVSFKYESELDFKITFWDGFMLCTFKSQPTRNFLR